MVTSLSLAITVALGFAAVAGGLSPVDASGDRGERFAAPAAVDTDRVVMEVQVAPNGSAHWRIEYRVDLDERTEPGFEQLRADIEADPGAVLEAQGFNRTVQAMVTSASGAVDREMVVHNESIEVETRRELQGTGVVAYRFRWYGFAAADDRLRVDEALGAVVSALGRNETLLVSWAENASLAEVSPEPEETRDSAVVWRGERAFAAGEPSVVLSSDSLSFGPDLGWDISSNDVFVTLGTLLIAVGTLGGGILMIRRRRGEDDEAETEDGTADEGAGPDDGSGPPAELLSNEERVLALLEEHGGRVKQQTVVQELEWSETKTSEVVSELRETDQVEVYRLGRSNVLALPETGIGYEFDDESRGEDR